MEGAFLVAGTARANPGGEQVQGVLGEGSTYHSGWRIEYKGVWAEGEARAEREPHQDGCRKPWLRICVAWGHW